MDLAIYFSSMLGVALEVSAVGLPKHSPLPSAIAASMEQRDAFIITYKENLAEAERK